MNRKKKKNRTSLKWKLLRIAILYWVLPFVVIAGTIGMFMADNEESSEMERILSQVQMSMDTCEDRLKGAVADSRQASYDKTLYNNYRQFKQGRISDRVFFNATQLYLDGQYAHKKDNSIAALLLTEEETEDKYASYNFGTGGSYEMVQTFYAEDQEKILSYAETLDTKVGFCLCENRLYIVRNMMDKHFKPWGVLVNRVYMEYCFEPLLSLREDFLVLAKLNGETVAGNGTEEEWTDMPVLFGNKEGGYEFTRNQVYAYDVAEDNDFQLSFVLKASRRELFQSLYGYKYIVVVMLLCLVPMMLLFLWLSRKYLSIPVQEMMDGAVQIEKGNLGYQIENDTGTMEFEYLRDSFNQMSGRLKYQFDHIYEEELALRDAKIMALQSHINPHFMNNTLEIINWEARLSGNEKVSRMIGALSTLMDGAMDRKKLPEVTLAEEMIYVNAYLYITTQRFGKRLTVEKELPEEIMNRKVPRLILQPIIENAIEHGVMPRGRGTVLIRGRTEGDYLYLEIINDGEFAGEDEERVKRLLTPDYDTSRESSGNLGIANVNQRLRILCGESCGLTIKSYNDHQTISTLTILAKN